MLYFNNLYFLVKFFCIGFVALIWCFWKTDLIGEDFVVLSIFLIFALVFSLQLKVWKFISFAKTVNLFFFINLVFVIRFIALVIYIVLSLAQSSPFFLHLQEFFSSINFLRLFNASIQIHANCLYKNFFSIWLVFFGNPHLVRRMVHSLFDNRATNFFFNLSGDTFFKSSQSILNI